MKTIVTLLAAVLAIAAAPGCGGGKGQGGDSDADALADVPDDTPGDAMDADTPDSAEGTDGDADEEEAPPPGVCEVLGLPVREMVEAIDDPALGAIAADFTVQTRDGAWTLSESWTGCEVYLFVQDEPAQEEGADVPLWSRDVNTLLSRSPRNVHYFFVSYEVGPAIGTALDVIQAEVEDALAGMSAEDQEWWRGHVHYVLDSARGIYGWIGTTMTNPGWGVGIDRFQKVRYIGSYADPTRPPSSGTEWFHPNISMAANEAVYYNFEAERQARLDADGATAIPVFNGEVVSDPTWAGARSYADVTFPDAAAMEAFDTMEFDMTAACVGAGERGYCPAWDYINSLYLCDEADPDACDLEIGRWITTYHREGRWVHDASGLLPLLSGGGARRLAVYSQQPYEIHLDIRLSDRGKAERPSSATYLFSGGHLDAGYNSAHAPVTVAIPVDAAKVELATVLSGHGMSMPGNCAEFCNVTHHFIVDGTDNVRAFPGAGTTFGCMDQVDEGTVPNQYGTWWYGRGGWCPGKEVPIVMIDVTGQVTPGTDAVFEYEAYYMGGDYTGPDANIDLTSWVVISI